MAIGALPAPFPVFAHAGHWLLGLAYFFPVIVLIGVILMGKYRDRSSGGPSPED
jgi:hypothetical protein